MSIDGFLMEAIGAVVAVFFLPGDGLVWLILQSNELAHALGVTRGMLGSFESAAISGLVWVAACSKSVRKIKR